MPFYTVDYLIHTINLNTQLNVCTLTINNLQKGNTHLLL